MQLTVETVCVKDAVLDEKTYLKNGILHLNLEELKEMVQDERFDSLEIELAKPGESCRISWVGDVIQPRVKTGAPEDTYPGMLGPTKRAGEGRTTVLDGVAVVEIWGGKAPMTQALDMSGPGAEVTPFSKTFNVVVVSKPAEGIEDIDYARALKKASLTTSRYLASLAIGTEPDKTEVFELPLLSGDAAGKSGLPRIAYIFQVFSTNALVEPLFYGDNCRGMLPNPVHPNEILDGALLNQNYEQILNAETSYLYCNHPLLKDLYARHGKDLEFVGVILKIAPFQQSSKERFAMLAATQAKYYLNADGVILTKEGGGHPQLDLSLTCQRCEELGVKTVIMVTEFFSAGGEKDESLIFNTDKADAIISNGVAMILDYPAMDRVIGPVKIPEFDIDIHEGFRTTCRLMRGTLSQVGSSCYKAVEQ